MPIDEGCTASCQDQHDREPIQPKRNHPRLRQSLKTCSKVGDGKNTGDNLLLRNLSKHYHRSAIISLACSGWERVCCIAPCHQRRTCNAGRACIRESMLWSQGRGSESCT